jgi:hypothetical protein
MAWQKPTPEMIATFEDILPSDRRVERKKIFGCPTGFVNGNMFAGLHENRVVLRLSDEGRQRLTKTHRVKAFEPLPGRVMKGWIVVPSGIVAERKSLKDLAGEAFAHTASLPPKAKKSKKNSMKRKESKNG